jgi:hypothetical protein
VTYSDVRVANRNLVFEWDMAHEAVSRGPLIFLSRTKGYTYAAKFWALSLVVSRSRTISVAPAKPYNPIRNFHVAACSWRGFYRGEWDTTDTRSVTITVDATEWGWGDVSSVAGDW